MYTYLPKQRFMLIGVYPKYFTTEDMLADLKEMEMLVKTYGGEVCALSVQKGESPSQSTYLRSGKAQNAADLIEKEKIDVVVAKDNLKSGQLFTLEKIFQRSNEKIIVWDKIFLILRIFDLHADTAEANLQIKIASLKHLGPRIYGMGYQLSQQGTGVGSKGQGETNTEVMKRHWRNEIWMIKKKIKELEKTRMQQIERRKRMNIKSVSLVGYTNSGKTSLFNKLTLKNQFVANRLFATLDSHTAKLYLEGLKREVILTDTIGFIRNLPAFLIDSFKSTLLESVNCDLIIHLVDASDPEMEIKIRTVGKILEELNLLEKKNIFVFNKVDLLKYENLERLKIEYQNISPLFISAQSGSGLKELLQTIEEKLLN